MEGGAGGEDAVGGVAGGGDGVWGAVSEGYLVVDGAFKELLMPFVARRTSPVDCYADVI